MHLLLQELLHRTGFHPLSSPRPSTKAMGKSVTFGFTLTRGEFVISYVIFFFFKFLPLSFLWYPASWALSFSCGLQGCSLYALAPPTFYATPRPLLSVGFLAENIMITIEEVKVTCRLHGKSSLFGRRGWSHFLCPLARLCPQLFFFCRSLTTTCRFFPCKTILIAIVFKGHHTSASDDRIVQGLIYEYDTEIM
jgi:hypothetical protein